MNFLEHFPRIRLFFGVYFEMNALIRTLSKRFLKDFAPKRSFSSVNTEMVV
jgi:hypothetical protein